VKLRDFSGRDRIAHGEMETERPASHEQLMEEVCERNNCWQAYKRVKANKEVRNRRNESRRALGYLKQHWPPYGNSFGWTYNHNR